MWYLIWWNHSQKCHKNIWVWDLVALAQCPILIRMNSILVDLMKRLYYRILTTSVLLCVSPGAMATDHNYQDDNSYFASKYHYKHSHHWRSRSISKQNSSGHWGRHHHHGIQLDGHDGRPWEYLILERIIMLSIFCALGPKIFLIAWWGEYWCDKHTKFIIDHEILLITF